MIGLILAAASLLVPSLARAAVPAYQHVSDTEILAVTMLEPAGLAVGLPPDVQLSWATAAGNLQVEVLNSSEQVVEVIWDRSAFVDAQGQSTGVVPGSTVKRDVKGFTPASVVPRGARLTEFIVRESAVDLAKADVAPLVDASDEGRMVSLTLALRSDHAELFVSQDFTVRVATDALDGLERQRMEAAELRERSDQIADLKREVSRHKNSALLFGGGAAAGGLVFGVLMPAALISDPTYEMTGEDWAAVGMLGGGSLAVGIPLAIYEARRAKEKQLQLHNLEYGGSTVREPTGR